MITEKGLKLQKGKKNSRIGKYSRLYFFFMIFLKSHLKVETKIITP